MSPLPARTPSKVNSTNLKATTEMTDRDLSDHKNKGIGCKYTSAGSFACKLRSIHATPSIVYRPFVQDADSWSFLPYTIIEGMVS